MLHPSRAMSCMPSLQHPASCCGRPTPSKTQREDLRRNELLVSTLRLVFGRKFTFPTVAAPKQNLNRLKRELIVCSHVSAETSAPSELCTLAKGMYIQPIITPCTGCRSISYASTLGKPVYIMENGIPAKPDDPKRKKWISGCLQQARHHLAPVHWSRIKAQLDGSSASGGGNRRGRKDVAAVTNPVAAVRLGKALQWRQLLG